jgi:ornithine cyclodeaminase
MLFLNRQDVEDLLGLDQLIDALAPAMIDLSIGAVSMPLRIAALAPEDQGLLGAMPAYVPSSRTLSTKLVSVYPNNPRSGLPAHQALIVLFDPASGAPLAVMDGAYITGTRPHKSGHIWGVRFRQLESEKQPTH